MITKTEIRFIITLDRKLKRGREQIEILLEKATKCTTAASADGSGSSSHSSDRGKYITAMIDLKGELKVVERKKYELQREAAKFIETIEDELTRKVMKYRYLECCTWRVTAELLGYDERYLRRKEFSCVREME